MRKHKHGGLTGELEEKGLGISDMVSLTLCGKISSAEHVSLNAIKKKQAQKMVEIVTLINKRPHVRC